MTPFLCRMVKKDVNIFNYGNEKDQVVTQAERIYDAKELSANFGKRMTGKLSELRLIIMNKELIQSGHLVEAV